MSAARMIVLSHLRAWHISVHSRGMATTVSHANRLNVHPCHRGGFTKRLCDGVATERSAHGTMRTCRASLSRQSSVLSGAANANGSAGNATSSRPSPSPTKSGSGSGHTGRAQVGLFDNAEEVKRRQSMSDLARLQHLLYIPSRKRRTRFAGDEQVAMESVASDYTELIDSTSSLSPFVAASTLFHSLLAERRLEISHLNVVIKNCFSSERQLQLVELGHRIGVQPDKHTVGTIVSRLMIEGDPAAARQTLDEMGARLPDKEAADLVGLTARSDDDLLRMRVALADRWVQIGVPGVMALHVLIDKLLTRVTMDRGEITPLYNVALKQRGMGWQAAQRLVDDMRRNEIPRDEYTYSTLLNIYRMQGVDGTVVRAQAEADGVARVQFASVLLRPEHPYDASRGKALRDLHETWGAFEYRAAWRMYRSLAAHGQGTRRVCLGMLGAAATEWQFERLVNDLRAAELNERIRDSASSSDESLTGGVIFSSDVVASAAYSTAVPWEALQKGHRESQYKQLFVAVRKWRALGWRGGQTLNVLPKNTLGSSDDDTVTSVSVHEESHQWCAHLASLLRWGLQKEALLVFESICKRGLPGISVMGDMVLDRLTTAKQWRFLDRAFELVLAAEAQRNRVTPKPAATTAAAVAETVAAGHDGHDGARRTPARHNINTMASAGVIDFRWHANVGPVVATLRVALARARALSQGDPQHEAGAREALARFQRLLGGGGRVMSGGGGGKGSKGLEAAWAAEDLTVLIDDDRVAATVDAIFSQLDPPVLVTWESRDRGVVDSHTLRQWASESRPNWGSQGWFSHYPTATVAVLQWP